MYNLNKYMSVQFFKKTNYQKLLTAKHFKPIKNTDYFIILMLQQNDIPHFLQQMNFLILMHIHASNAVVIFHRSHTLAVSNIRDLMRQLIIYSTLLGKQIYATCTKEIVRSIYAICLITIGLDKNCNFPHVRIFSFSHYLPRRKSEQNELCFECRTSTRSHFLMILRICFNCLRTFRARVAQ